jgi:hypothetical protein
MDGGWFPARRFRDHANDHRHILTGLGVYYYIQFLLYLRLCLEGTRIEFDFEWAYGCLPYIRRKNRTGIDTKSNDKHANGIKLE